MRTVNKHFTLIFRWNLLQKLSVEPHDSTLFSSGNCSKMWYFPYCFIRPTRSAALFVTAKYSHANISEISLFQKKHSSTAGVYLLKVNDRNTRTRCEICSKLTINTPERRQWSCSGVFIVNFEHISLLVLVILLLTLNM